MLNRFEEEDYLFLDKIFFSDEATFHLSGKVNRHNLIIWGSQNLHQVVEHVRDSPKVNVFCAASRTQVYAPLFFRRGYRYGSRVSRYAGALPCTTVGCKQCYLATRWGPAPPSRGCDAVPEPNIPGKMDMSWWLHLWSPRSPDPTHMDSSLWRFVEDNAYISYMPVDLQELRDRIANAIALVDVTFLNKLWYEL
jgi:hypothetical protein